MNRLFLSLRLVAVAGLNSPYTPRGTLSFVRCYAVKKGKKKKSSGKVLYDSDLAEGLVDLQKLKSNMQDTIDRLRQDYMTKVTVRILPTSLDHIRVQTDHGKAPLCQLAQISIKGNQMFVIDMSTSAQFTRQATQAIRNTGANYDPAVEGHVITVPIPRMTQEHRENLSKLAKATSEQSKQALRRVRQKGINDVRKNKEGHSEDDTKRVEQMIQHLTDEFAENVNILVEEKTKELMRT